MNRDLQAAFPASPAVYSSADPIALELFARQRNEIAALADKAVITDKMLPENRIVVGSGKPQTIVGRNYLYANFYERIFSSLVALKVAVSQYAMHLNADERHRIFDQLDSIINVEDWHQGDELPRPQSFTDFLKWMIYSKYFRWTSIGVSDDGGILVAWKTDRVLLTANFISSDSVRWTAQITSEAGEVGHTVGKCPLRLFAKQALFYLHQGADGEDNTYSG